MKPHAMPQLHQLLHFHLEIRSSYQLKRRANQRITLIQFAQHGESLHYTHFSTTMLMASVTDMSSSEI